MYNPSDFCSAAIRKRALSTSPPTIGAVSARHDKGAKLCAARNVDEPSKPDERVNAQIAKICGRSPKVPLENMRHHDWKKEFVNSNRD